jgi:hypothetical protein
MSSRRQTQTQVRNHDVFCSGEFEKRFIAVDADYVPVWSNSLCNASSNGAGAAADVKHAKPWPQQFGKAAMVPLKSSSA